MKTLLNLALLTFISFSLFSQTNRIDINSINVKPQAKASLFYPNNSTTPAFEAIKGSGMSTIFATSLWIGGIRTDSSLGMAYQTYIDTNLPAPFATGPLTVVNGSGTGGKKDFGLAQIDSIEKAKWNKVFCVTKNEIEEFKHWFACSQDASCNTSVLFPGYTIPTTIMDWPAHGDGSLMQDPYLAPFWDNDLDGIYDPNGGDFPCIKGDEYCWYILNDRGYDSSSFSMGIEIHVEMYAFKRDSTSPIDKTLFLGYDIINRSTETYRNFRVGQWTDFDLGCALDDYIGSMPNLNSYYAYNGDATDDNCSGGAIPYGINPPAQGVTFLNQRMTSSMYHSNSSGNQGDPTNEIEAFYYMNSKWKDGTHLKYGGNGYPIPSGTATGPDTNHTLPYGSMWTEHFVGNPAGDRRFLGSVGGFNLTPGDVIEVDLAFTFSRSDSGNLKSVDQLYRDIQVVQAFYNDSIKPCSDSLIGFTGISENKNKEISFSIFPNPANNYFSISSDLTESFDIQLIDVQGKTILEKQNIRPNQQIELPNLASGVYFVKLANNTALFKTKKLIVQ